MRSITSCASAWRDSSSNTAALMGGSGKAGRGAQGAGGRWCSRDRTTAGHGARDRAAPCALTSRQPPVQIEIRRDAVVDAKLLDHLRPRSCSELRAQRAVVEQAPQRRGELLDVARADHDAAAVERFADAARS